MADSNHNTTTRTINGRKKMYRIFKRAWWEKNGNGEIIPGTSRGSTLTHRPTYAEAQAYCREWNAENPVKNWQSIKAEFEHGYD